MKKLSSLFGKFCLIALLALSLFTSCNDDQDTSTPEPPASDNGFYIVNEGWAGHDPGSINYYDLVSRNLQEELYQSNNEGMKLGETSTNGIIHNDKMYIVSKITPYLVQVNKSDFKHIAAIEGDGAIGRNGQAHNFCIVNNTTGILTGSAGAFKVTLAPLALGEQIVAGKCGDIVKAGDYIFMIVDSHVNVYSSSDLKLVKENIGAANTGLTQSKDGSIWAANGNTLLQINSSTLAVQTVTLPDELKVHYDATYHPSTLVASKLENALYFRPDGWTVKKIYKYTIDTKVASIIMDSPELTFSIYSTLSVSPQTGNIVAIFTEDGYGDHYKNNKIVIADGITGAEIKVIDYSGVFWFPSIVVFE